MSNSFLLETSLYVSIEHLQDVLDEMSRDLAYLGDDIFRKGHSDEVLRRLGNLTGKVDFLRYLIHETKRKQDTSPSR